MRTDAAGWLFLGLAFTFIACTSTKKTTTTSLHTTDTASSFRSKTKVDTASRNSVVKASDVDVYYYYDTSAPPSAAGKQPQYTADIANGDAPTYDLAFIPHSKLVAVHVHVGDFSDSSTSSTSHKSVDTTHKQSGQTSQLNQVIVDKKTVIAWWMYVAGGLLLLLLLLFIVYKIVK